MAKQSLTQKQNGKRIAKRPAARSLHHNRLPGAFDTKRFSAYEFGNLLESMSMESAEHVNAVLDIAAATMRNVDAAAAFSEQQKIVAQLRRVMETGGTEALNRLATALSEHSTN